MLCGVIQQSGTFVVSVVLLDAKSEQLAIKSQKTKVVAGKAAELTFDFVSEISKAGDCRTEGDSTLITEGPLGGNSLSVLWDVDHYQLVYTDSSVGNGDLMSVQLDAQGHPLAQAISIQTSPRVSALPSIAKLDTGYVVAWQEGNKLDPNPVVIQIRRLDSLGNPVGNVRQIPTNATEARPMIKVVDGKIAMAWIDDRGTVAAPARIAMMAYLSADDFTFDSGSPLTLSPPDSSLGNDDAFLLLRVVADESEILTLAVRPSARRQGLAALLVTAALGMARGMGAQFIFLEVAADNTGAIALYEKSGFKRHGTRRGYYARGGAPAVDGLLMRCELNSPAG